MAPEDERGRVANRVRFCTDAAASTSLSRSDGPADRRKTNLSVTPYADSRISISRMETRRFTGTTRAGLSQVSLRRVLLYRDYGNSVQ